MLLPPCDRTSQSDRWYTVTRTPLGQILLLGYLKFRGGLREPLFLLDRVTLGVVKLDVRLVVKLMVGSSDYTRAPDLLGFSHRWISGMRHLESFTYPVTSFYISSSKKDENKKRTRL